MTPNQFWNHYLVSNKDRISEVCAAADTSLGNFQQIAVAGGSVGKALAKRLALASNEEMTVLEILYPEDYEDTAA